MPERKRISVDVDSIDHDLVKIKWRRELPWGPAYSVPRGMLEEKADEVRSRLEALVANAMQGNVKKSGPILKEIAEAGNKLYRALFHDPAGPGKATKTKNYLQSFSDPHQITFSMGVPLHVPWGLIYDGDPNQLSGDSEDLDFAHYQNFWCIKYQTASVYHTVDPEGANKPLPGDLVRMHSVVNQTVYDRTGPYLVKDGDQYWNWLKNRFGEPVFTQRDWLARWQKEYERVGLLYFYGHATGNKIGLATDTISANDLAQEFTEQTGATLPCLVFLNGCSTAVGDHQGGFLQAIAGSRFCGFIGAEASIPEVYALRFGSAFLCEFYRGEKNVIDIMSDLRKRHWPLSLIYHAYCVPNLQIMPAPPSPPDVKADNFCDFDLGTKGI